MTSAPQDGGQSKQSGQESRQSPLSSEGLEGHEPRRPCSCSLSSPGDIFRWSAQSVNVWPQDSITTRSWWGGGGEKTKQKRTARLARSQAHSLIFYTGHFVVVCPTPALRTSAPPATRCDLYSLLPFPCRLSASQALCSQPPLYHTQVLLAPFVQLLFANLLHVRSSITTSSNMLQSPPTRFPSHHI